jgi:UDP-N-acetylmuramoylalanine--D-glutamate ligase
MATSIWRNDDGRTWLMRRDTRLLALDEMKLAGRHNALNALAALRCANRSAAAGRPLHRRAARFRGLPHRVETVLDVEGVRFIDDSKGTNVGATVAAIEGLGRPLCLIAGGDGKGQDFAPLARSPRATPATVR